VKPNPVEMFFCVSKEYAASIFMAGEKFNPRDRRNTFSLNSNKLLPDYTASRHTR
jgi:hypothetical protein